MAFIAAGPTTTRGDTDAAGNAFFAGLPPGTYSVDDSDTPFEFIDRLDRFCSETGAPGNGVPFASTDRGLRVELEPGQRVVCDVHYVGTAFRGFPTATLTVPNRLCPVGFAGPD